MFNYFITRILAVAFMTLMKEKFLSAMQRRCGPNVVDITEL